MLFVGSTVGSTAGALSKFAGAVGTSLAKLTFDENYKNARIRRKEESTGTVTDIAVGGKHAAMVCRWKFVGYLLFDMYLIECCSWSSWYC